MTRRIKAEIQLICVTLCWGISYVMIDVCLTELGPFTLNALRFLGAFFIASVLTFRDLKNVGRATLRYSAILGIVLVFVYAGATFGVKYTSLSNAGFLCSLTFVFTPIFGYIFKGQKVDKRFILVVILSLIGVMLMTLNEEFKPALGDIICLICAFSYAADLLITETAVNHEEVDPYQLGVFQLGFTGIFNLILSYILEEPQLPSSLDVWGCLLFLAIFCTGLAFIIQTVAQQFTTASRVGIIFTLEPVFAAFAAFIFAHEILLFRGYIGAGIMLLALILMETGGRKKEEEG